MGVLEFEERQHISAPRRIEHTFQWWRYWPRVEFSSVLRIQRPTNGTYPERQKLG